MSKQKQGHNWKVVSVRSRSNPHTFTVCQRCMLVKFRNTSTACTKED